MSTNVQMYLLSNNGGRSILLSVLNHWYCCECAPSGAFVDVDLYEGEEAAVAAKIANEIKSGDIDDLYDLATTAVQGGGGFGAELKNIYGCTIKELEHEANYEINSSGDVAPKAYDTTSYTLITEDEIALEYFQGLWDDLG